MFISYKHFKFVIQTLLLFWLIRCSRWLALKICQIISLRNSTSLNNVNCCSVHFTSRKIQGRKDFIFEPFDKSIFTNTIKNHQNHFWILVLIWVDFRHYFLLNFSNQSRLPGNTIFVMCTDNRVCWQLKLIGEVD